MEVKINREIRNYTESVFFGLSLRQFIFSVLAVGVAIGLGLMWGPKLSPGCASLGQQAARTGSTPCIWWMVMVRGTIRSL